jgi:hypothetical protein
MKLMQKQLILLIYFCKGQSGNNNKKMEGKIGIKKN